MKTYSLQEEKANSISHLIGALMGIVVCTFFVYKGSLMNSSIAVMSLCLYFFGVVSSYLTSTIYHACPAEKMDRKALLRKFDHAAIYWHIAGSYSPITLIAMREGGNANWAWVIFGLVWLCAAVGTALSFRKMKTHNHIGTLCYVLMGLLILVAFKPFYESTNLAIVLWVVAEGVCYITGAVLYSIHKIKYTHTIFHVFVIFGDICHIIAVWFVLNLF